MAFIIYQKSKRKFSQLLAVLKPEYLQMNELGDGFIVCKTVIFTRINNAE